MTLWARLMSLMSSPVLAPSCPPPGLCIKHTDDCDREVGVLLLQKQPDWRVRPIGHWSILFTLLNKCLNCTTECECPRLMGPIALAGLLGMESTHRHKGSLHSMLHTKAPRRYLRSLIKDTTTVLVPVKLVSLSGSETSSSRHTLGTRKRLPLVKSTAW